MQHLRIAQKSKINTDNPLYTDTRYNDKIRNNDNLFSETYA